MNELETLELAAYLVGMDPEADDFDERTMEAKLEWQFDIGMDSFHRLASALVRFTLPAAPSPLTGTVYQGFVKDGAFIAKLPVKPHDAPV